MLWYSPKNNKRKGSIFHKCMAELVLSSEIAEDSHIRFLVWGRNIAMKIGLTPSLFCAVCLETEKVFYCKKRKRYEGSAMRCPEQFAGFPWQQSFSHLSVIPGQLVLSALPLLLQSSRLSLCLWRLGNLRGWRFKDIDGTFSTNLWLCL